ncbi:hypothetical protein BN2476_960022 [Paraburkholderia piptadeniae]|uniref:Uncharacterized protein n=1 Tax=Paraburkholderia piptadeniae TaxID=1701573 RepID=A0A1N7STR1_9BURK|nr:hypothetical protein BN2476_960022 [Paraburkholderia piptadeniae]
MNTSNAGYSNPICLATIFRHGWWQLGHFSTVTRECWTSREGLAAAAARWKALSTLLSMTFLNSGVGWMSV